MNKYFLKIIKRFTYHDIDIKQNYRMVRRAKNVMSPKFVDNDYIILDLKIESSIDGYKIPVRVFKEKESYKDSSVIFFFHGGGWVIGNIDNYSRICRELAKNLNSVVLSVDYRLAPEYKFPVGLNDCYDCVCSVIDNIEEFGFKKENIALMGDSAGGNLAACVSLMLRDNNRYIPNKQILIYPSTYNDHSENSPFRSVNAFGKDYLLTTKRIKDYMELYASSSQDFNNPYFAPLISNDLSNQPDTLIITAWYDPLRDEGEAYASKLKLAGNYVELYRIFDTIHGFLVLPSGSRQMNKTYRYINKFLNRKG